MNIPIEILNSSIYKEIMDLSKLKNIKLNWFQVSDDNGIGYGYTHYKPEVKIIDIFIANSSMKDINVFMHELLHAKLSLLGFPSIALYEKIEIHPSIPKIIASLQNTVQHTYIYRNLEALGYEFQQLNDLFFQNIYPKEINSTQKGVDLALPMNLLEAYLRDKHRANDLVKDLKNSFPNEVNLYTKLVQILKQIKPNTPADMRILYVKLLKAIDDHVLEHTNEHIYLNILVKVEPAFDSNTIKLPASKALQTKYIKGYPHVFVLDKQYNQTCFFLSNHGAKLQPEVVEELLKNNTVKSFLRLLGY